MRALSLRKNERIRFENVSVDHLSSYEGVVFGIEVVPDTNDRSDWYVNPMDNGITFSNVEIGSNLIAGSGSKVHPVSSDLLAGFNFSGVTVKRGPLIHRQLARRRLVISHAILTRMGTTRRNFGLPLSETSGYPSSDPTERSRFLSVFGTEQRLYKFRDSALSWFHQTFGIDLASQLAGKVWYEPVYLPHGVFAASTISVKNKYSVISACDWKGRCVKDTHSEIIDVVFAFAPHPGTVLHGTWGGDAGKKILPGDALVVGAYNFLNSSLGACLDLDCREHADLTISYFAECPIATQTFADSFPERFDNVMINYLLDSDAFGRGRTVGAGFHWNNQQKQHVSHIGSIMVFDDVPQHPKYEMKKRTPLPDRSQDTSSILSPQRQMVFLSGKEAEGDFGFDGFQVFPSGKIGFFNEALQSFLLRWRPHTDALQLRKDFMAHVRKVIKLDRVLNRAFDENDNDYSKASADTGFDLGGGNTMKPYTIKRIREHASRDASRGRSYCVLCPNAAVRRRIQAQSRQGRPSPR